MTRSEVRVAAVVAAPVATVRRNWVRDSRLPHASPPGFRVYEGRMKIRLVNPVSDALRRLSNARDPATGKKHKFESPLQLKQQVDLEALITDTLGHDPVEDD